MRLVFLLPLAGCFSSIPETPGAQAKQLFHDPDGYIGQLDGELSQSSPRLKARQIHDLDIYKDWVLAWDGPHDGKACFRTIYQTPSEKTMPDEAREDAVKAWNHGKYVITTFDSREEILALAHFPESGEPLDISVIDVDVTRSGRHVNVSLRLCGQPTGIKETAKFLAVMQVPKDSKHIGGLYLWAIQR